MSAIVLAYHEMGCRCLETLLRRSVEVAAVFTHEDRAGEDCWFGSVAGLARRHRIPVFTPEDINDPLQVQRIRDLAPAAIFSFHYRRIVGRAILEVPARGCVNLHPSLLPAYRGRCPINWQIIRGEVDSGVTLHHMIEAPDAGDIIGQEAVPVGPDDRAIDLYKKLLPAAERLVLRHLDGILEGTAPRVPQDVRRATTFGGRTPADGRIDWSRPAAEIHNLVRGVAPPWPGAFTVLERGRLMIHRTRVCRQAPLARSLEPGELGLLGGRVYVGAGDGKLLELLEHVTVPRFELGDGDRSASPSTSSGARQGVER